LFNIAIILLLYSHLNLELMLLNYLQKQNSLNEVDQRFENIFVLHGLFASLSSLAGLTTQLSTTHRIIAVDLRNHGNSPHNPSMSYQEMAEDLFALADHLHIKNFSIIGHSLGGKVAMVCALQRPERINKLVISDIAPVSYPNKHRDIFNGLQALAKQRIMTRKSADLILSEYIKTEKIRQFLLKSLYKQGEEYQLKFNLKAITANYDQLRNWPLTNTVFNNEILFIKGGDSDYILPKYKTDILQLFPKAKVKIISNTGHWPHVEKATTFNRLVSRFFTPNC
jgi:esterase